MSLMEWQSSLGTQDLAFVRLIQIVFFIVLLVSVFTLVSVTLRMANNRRLVRTEELQRRWESTLIEVLSGDRQPKELAAMVQPHEGTIFIDFLLRFAGRLRGEEREMLSDLAAPYLGQISQHLKSGTNEQRAATVQALSTLGLPKYLLETLAALRDPSPLVSIIAACALSSTDYVVLTPLIIDRIDKFSSWSPGFLATMLAGLGSEAAPKLRTATLDAELPISVRVVALDALRELHDPRTASIAVSLIARETDRDLIAASLRLLAEVGHDGHVEHVTPLVHSPDFVVRAHAITALAELGDEDVLPLLMEAIMDESPWAALRAAKGLVQMQKSSYLTEMIAEDHPRATLARQVLDEEILV